MKWLLVLSLALVARGGLLQVDPPIDDDVVTDLPAPIIDTDGEPIPEPEPEPEPEISEIIYEEIPEPPEEGGHDNDTDGTVLSRNKRFITTGTYLWPNNHVMYSYKTGQFPNEASKSSTQFSIGYLKDRTCVSFTEVDDATYKSSHVKFIVGSGCYANLGYNPYGYTKCSCCSKGTCYHEMLHLLGFMHEHQRPDRDRYIEVDWLKISRDKWSQFKKLKESSINHIDGHIYKVGSTMHYSGWAFQQELFGASIKTVNDDYNMAEDFYYPIREVNLRYKCKEADCSNFTKTCVNDGYVTKYMGHCKCVCPEGLSPNDGCSKAVTSPNAVDWPSGSYAFVAAGSGCPIGFDIGYRKHYSRGYSWSIFGTWKNPMKGVQDHASTEYEFCVSKNNFPTSGNKWPAGVYCLHRVGGTCPEGFHSGSVQLDDYIKDQYHNNTKAGVLPDGVFDQDTKFEFCCRNDGLMTIPIEVPLTNEFVLYQAEYRTSCQEVKDFDSYTFDFTFDNYNSASGTIASSSGRAPYYHRYSGDRVYFWFNACHYTPLDLTCGATIDLDSANPSQTFSTSNYPSNYSPLQKCNFLITAPEGSQIYLDFNTFDVHSTDSVQVRVFNIGEQHSRFSTHNGKTFRSYTNKMTVIFQSGKYSQAKGFEASVRYVKNEDNCYDINDYGESYRGDANTTKYFETCLPWSETSSCEYSSQHPKDAEAGLEGNYCRNPGSADRPWCYTEVTECTRRVCDVCQQGKIHDVVENCQTLISTVPNFCSKDPRASANCRLSCIAEHPLPAKPPSRSSVSCSPPTVIPTDGHTTDIAKAAYDVGDKITYTCNNNAASSISIMCSLEGKFNSILSACKVCDDGWLALNGLCYFKVPYVENYPNALTTCKDKNAKLVMPKTTAANNFLIHNRDLSNTWIGVNDIATEGTWKWLDNTPLEVKDMHFGKGQPSNHTIIYDCAALSAIPNTPFWVDLRCNSRTYANTICEKSMNSDTCNDLFPDCAQRAAQDSQFCSADNGFAALYCPSYCSFCFVPGSHCNVPPAGANSIDITTSHTLSPREELASMCYPGYMVTSGDLKRICLSSTSFTGSAPVCEAEVAANVITPSNNVALRGRYQTISTLEGYMFSGDYEQFNIPRAGEIVSWEYFSRVSGNVGLMVYRYNGTNLKLVGYNYITTQSSNSMPSTYNVPIADRIDVEKGDKIGIWFEENKQAIDVNYHADSLEYLFPREQIRRSYLSSKLKADLNIGTTYKFYVIASTVTEAKTLYGSFSLRANIGPRT